jgi:hypothetical protein
VIKKSRICAFVVLASLSAGVGGLTTLASAQPRRRPPAPAAATKKPTKDAGVEADLDASAPLTARAESTAAAQATGPKDKDAGFVEARTLDGGARVFRFGEVEIEGRLRSPQLVYFLRRVRAEFAAGDLGHRSFMRELSDTRRDPSF